MTQFCNDMERYSFIQHFSNLVVLEGLSTRPSCQTWDDTPFRVHSQSLKCKFSGYVLVHNSSHGEADPFIYDKKSRQIFVLCPQRSMFILSSLSSPHLLLVLWKYLMLNKPFHSHLLSISWNLTINVKVIKFYF